MKSDPALRSIPVLIISASDAVNRRGLAVAGADYVVKPVARPWLVEAVKEELGSLRGKRILVADDDPKFRAQVRAFLGEEGVCEIVEAGGGSEALASIATRTPDLLLLDLLMPDIDGFEVLRRLRVDRRAVNLPVLVVTSKDLSLEEKAYVKRRLATLVRKGGADPNAIVRAALQQVAEHGARALPSR
jgi:CheY-like chemotaxis protein